MTEHEWVIEALRFYRPMGFFVEHVHLSDAELADELIARNAARGGRSYLEEFIEVKAEAAKVKAEEREEWEMGLPEVWADMLLLAHDTNRVLWVAGEEEIAEGDEVYSTFLKDCSRISRGAFTINNVEEEWEGKILERLRFDFSGERWSIHPGEQYGWIDWEILDAVNEFIRHSGYGYYISFVGDEAFIVVLTAAELQKFETERGWDFGYEEEGDLEDKEE